MFGKPPTMNHKDNDPNIQEGWKLVETGFEDNKTVQYFKSWLIEKACWFEDDNVLKHANIRGAHPVKKLPKKIEEV